MQIKIFYFEIDSEDTIDLKPDLSMLSVVKDLTF